MSLEGCRKTYVKRAQIGGQEDLFGRWHSLLSQIFYFLFPTNISLYHEECVYVRVCVCIHLSECLEILYE